MMLGTESRIPVHLWVIKVEDAVLFFHLDICVVRTGQDLIFEGSELVFLADVVDFVDDCADGGVFIHQNGGDEGFVGKILVAKIEMGFKTLIALD